MSEENKSFWFCFSFSGKEIGTDRDAQASAYVGYQKRNITLKMIKDSKVQAGLTDKAVLMGCSYLGYMKKSEFIS